MDAWGNLDIGAAIVRDDLGSSFRRTKKLMSKIKYIIGVVTVTMFQFEDLKEQNFEYFVRNSSNCSQSVRQLLKAVT
ncbi:hypothetical protein NQ318_003055 [Aromia moschata]|uniref:Uncharacterized protein n=1 Tax=Aromia moschata TaxID=1265417 RepID=A0AAV8Y4S9_9CUCU|nr:hypothetical protein NQ318_003055 [Aromia moschata]